MNDAKERIKAACSGQWRDILADIGGLPIESLDGRSHPCPRCQGTDRFSMISEERGAVLCRHCHNSKNGDGISAIMWARGWNFKTAMDALGRRVGIPFSPDGNGDGSNGNGRGRPELERLHCDEATFTGWVSKKPGITVDAVKRNGAKVATRHGYGGDLEVIALPILAPNKEEPAGYAMYRADGKGFPKAKGAPAKIMCTRGAGKGWLGKWAIEHIDDAELVWKVEGASDMLALSGAIPPELRTRHVVLSNPFGAGEGPKPVHFEALEDKDVVVVHDTDSAGRKGARKWAKAIAGVAAGVRVLDLPVPAGTKGAVDIRDLLVAGYTYEDLLELAEQAEVVDPDRDSNGSPIITPCDESEAETPAIADAICRDEHFAIDDGDKLYRFHKGRYIDDGKRHIHRRVKARMVQIGQQPKWSCRKQSEVIGYISADAPELWEKPPSDRINVRNGILDLETQELGPHDPGWLSPVQLPVKFDPAARCPAWEEFISEVFPLDAQEVAWQIPAWLMTPHTDIQKAILLRGEGGEGKSTYLAGVTAFIGKRNIAAVPLQRLESDRFAVARLVGKLANIVPDLPAAHLATTSTFKAITGGDALLAERKFHDSFELVPSCRLVFSANRPPSSSDPSEAFFSRWLVVPFDRGSFRDSGREIPRKVLDARLADPRELSGVLNKALEHLPQVLEHGISEPDSMVRAKTEFRATTDPVTIWLDQNVVEVPGAVVSKKCLLDRYNEAADRGGRPRENSTAFGLAVRRWRPDLRDGQRLWEAKSHTWCWLDIGLRERRFGASEAG